MVLPEPDGPMMRVSSPERRSMLLGCSAVMMVSPALYSLPAAMTRATIFCSVATNVFELPTKLV